MPAVIALPAIPGSVHPDCKCHLNERMSGICCCAGKTGKSCCGKTKPPAVAKSCCATKADTSMCRSDRSASTPPVEDEDEVQLSACGCGGPISQGGLLSSDPRLISTPTGLESPAALFTRCCEFQENWNLFEEAPATPPPEAA